MMSNPLWLWRRSNPPVPEAPVVDRPETPLVTSGGSAEALCSIFGDEEVSDVILQGYDGGNVVAVKAILASRSIVFRQMFFQNGGSSFTPSEPGEKEVFVFDEWDCRILHLVVEYCYTDSCSAMKIQPTEDITRMMAALRVASKAFKLPGLLDKIKQWIWRQISRYPALACAMVDEGIRNDDVDDFSLQTLQLKTRAALLPEQRAVGSGVLALSKPGLLFVLRTLDETTSHHLLLQLIERWVDFSNEDSLGGSNAISERASREAFARKCAMRFVNVSKIPKENLDIVMKRSNLFTTDNLISATMSHRKIQYSRSSEDQRTTQRKPVDRAQMMNPSTKAQSTSVLYSNLKRAIRSTNPTDDASDTNMFAIRSMSPTSTNSTLSSKPSMQSQ